MGDLGQRNVPELPKGLRSGAGGVGPLRAGRITLEEALHRYQLTEEGVPVLGARLRAARARRLAQHAPSAISRSAAAARPAFAPLTRPTADRRFGVVSERAPAAGRAKQRRLARPATRAENRRPAPA